MPLFSLQVVVAVVVVPVVPLGALALPSILKVAGTAVAGGRHCIQRMQTGPCRDIETFGRAKVRVRGKTQRIRERREGENLPFSEINRAKS